MKKQLGNKRVIQDQLTRDLNRESVKMRAAERNVKFYEDNPHVEGKKKHMGVATMMLNGIMSSVNYLLDSWLSHELPKHDEHGEDVPYD